MEIGISTASFFSKSTTEDSFSIIKSLGFKTCEVFLTTFSEYKYEFGVLLQEKSEGIDVYSVHSLNQHYEPELFNIVERTRKDSEFYFKEVCNIAKILNAKYYTFHGPARLKKTKYFLDFQWISDRLFSLNTILSTITQCECLLAYENVHWTYFNDPSFFESLKKISQIKACLDIKQAMQSGIDIYSYIDVMHDRLVNVHLCDYNEKGELRIPGRGCFDFTKLFFKLISIGYNGPLMIEVYPKDYNNFDELAASKEYLEDCLNKAYKKFNKIGEIYGQDKRNIEI